MYPTVCRIVQYKLTAADASDVNRRRAPGAGHGEGWPLGAQAHVGNSVAEGDVFPAVVVRSWPESPTCNLHVLLDGTDSLWRTSVSEGPTEGQPPGTWAWPARS